MMLLNEIQKVEFDILVSLIDFFDSNQIQYSLGFGSLIGVVRHNGFIPWDDDIDVFMMRDEFNKFLKLIEKQNYRIDENYLLLTQDNTNGYYYPFPKLVDTRTIVDEYPKKRIPNMGLWVDIFPIDFCAETKEVASKIAKKQFHLTLSYYRFLLGFKPTNLLNIAKIVFLFFYKILFFSVPFRFKRRCEMLANNKKMSYAGVLNWCFSENDVYPSEWLKEYTWGTFENKRVMIFKEFDKILRYRYGNYMQPPDESEKVSHSIVAEWKK